MLYPLRFTPVYFEKVWGDRRLETIMGRTLPPGQPIGESWEIADHPHGRSVIANGSLRGTTLHELIRCEPDGILGAHVRARFDDVFPLLLKYIDADDKLSVQVHPDDAYALAHEGEPGKTEAWFVLHADPGAEIIAGLCDGVTREAYGNSLTAGDPAALLRHLPVRAGDTILIPAGRIHALLPGVLVLEIQQNSDTTYRLYDWERVGLDGKPRELHIEKALAVTNWSDDHARAESTQTERLDGTCKSRLVTCEYFIVDKYDLAGRQVMHLPGDRFHFVNCVAGAGTLSWSSGAETLRFGDSALIPAVITEIVIETDGEASFLVSRVS